MVMPMDTMILRPSGGIYLIPFPSSRAIITSSRSTPRTTRLYSDLVGRPKTKIARPKTSCHDVYAAYDCRTLPGRLAVQLKHPLAHLAALSALCVAL